MLPNTYLFAVNFEIKRKWKEENRLSGPKREREPPDWPIWLQEREDKKKSYIFATPCIYRLLFNCVI